MALDATARRRWIGALFLLAALAMLIGGQTVLQGRLGDTGFIIFWLFCLVFTGMAIAVAFLDVRALQRRVRQDQRDLFETTLKKIETDAKAKGRPPNGAKPEPRE
jgi:hypothetical protein